MTLPAKQILSEVNEFYEHNPFPGFDLRKYSYSEDLRRRASWVGRLLDAQIPYDAGILDAGCGTGQMANFLALKGRQVTGIDYSRHSLQKARALSERLGVTTAHFQHANILECDLPDNSFDFVLSLGVLHHTSDPYGGFENLVRMTRHRGFLIIGLYNSMGRLAIKIRRHFKRVFQKSRIDEKAVRRQLAGDSADLEKNESWLADQYYHPHESTHSVPEVLGWFRRHSIDYVNSIPPIELFQGVKSITRVFKPNHLTLWKRHPLALILKQLKWSVSLKDNGGYFIMIGRKR